MEEGRRSYPAPGQSWRLTRSQSHGGRNLSVPLWEKRFCTDACAIPWSKLCETKRLMSLYKTVIEWDDSAALEAFRDAKARFCAEYHGQPCDIPLPDPYMYIDKVNPDGFVDPELVSDLEEARYNVLIRDSAKPERWDSFIFADKPVLATGWGDGETSDIPGQQFSVNWDNYVEQPIQFQTPLMPSSGDWDDAIRPDSWGNQRDSYYGSESQDGSFGHWRRKNNKPGRRKSGKRDGGGYLGISATKPKYHGHEHDNLDKG